MKRLLKHFLIVISLGLTLASNLNSKEIKIGVMLGFSGPIETLTPAMADAAELAFIEASSSGDLLDGSKIKSIRGDSTCVDSSAAIRNAKKLIKQKVVAILGADCSGVTGAVASNVTVPNGMVLISPSATSPSLTSFNDKGYFFRTTPSDARGAEVLAQISKEKGIRSLAITYTNNDYGKFFAQNFKKALSKYGIKVTITLPHEDGRGSYSNDVIDLSSAGGDALAVIGYLDQGGRGIIDQSLKSGAFDKFILSDGMIGSSLTNKFGKKLNKSFGLLPGSTSIGASQFADFSKKNGLDPSSPYTGESYDAAALIVLAIQAGGSADKESIKKNIMAVANGPGKKIYPGQLKKALKLLAQGKQINYEGSTNIEFSKVGETFGSFLAQDIKNGKFKTARMISGVGPEQNTVITKIVKKTEPKKQTKKEETKKVVKKQDEFVPVFNKDETPPILTIEENIIVSSASYEITGRVSDEGSDVDKIYVKVDGSFYPVKKGKFQISRFSPVDELIQIIAIDQWGNESIKTINVKVNIEDKVIVKKLEPLDPSKIKVKTNKSRVALIIGIENYSNTAEALYADRDAKFFKEYAKKAFGIEDNNIKLLINDDAALVNSLSILSKWLPGKIEKKQTELIIFFAGHGLASNDGKELFLLTQDSDADLLSRTALSRTEIFNKIKEYNPKSTLIFLDACYTGFSREKETLLASARPVRVTVGDQSTPENFTIFSASQLDQISSGLEEAEHGIFSYYLMKGLEGKADINKDKKITTGELLAYMDQNVSQKASELGRQQNPSLAGDPDKVLMSYR